MKEGGDFTRRQSTLSETLARVVAPNFAFIIFAVFFLFFLISHAVFATRTFGQVFIEWMAGWEGGDVRVTNKITQKRVVFVLLFFFLQTT